MGIQCEVGNRSYISSTLVCNGCYRVHRYIVSGCENNAPTHNEKPNTIMYELNQYDHLGINRSGNPFSASSRTNGIPSLNEVNPWGRMTPNSDNNPRI